MTLLIEADALINGERRELYGEPKEFFEEVAKKWSVTLGVEVTAKKVILCMIDFKTIRVNKAPDHRDSILDVAGYAGLYEHVL